MTSDACREFRGALGAASLAGRDAIDDPALRAHLDGCADCRAELRDLSSVARALPLADPRRSAVGAAEPPPGLGERVRDRLARRRVERRRRTQRRVGLLAAAAVIAAVVSLTTVVALRRPEPPTTQVTFPAASAGVSAWARLRARSAGTEVELHVRGLHDGDAYWLWLTGDDNKRIGAGTFRSSRAQIDVTMTAALPLVDARRIWVTDADDAVVLDSRVSTS